MSARPPQATRPRRRRRRRALVPVALLLLLGLGAVALLAVSWGVGRESLRARVERKLAGATGGTVRLGALEGPLYPEVTLRDLVIESPSGDTVRLERVHVRFQLGPLLRSRTLVVDSLALTGPTLESAIDTDAPPAEAGPVATSRRLPFSIEVKQLRWTGARVRLRSEGDRATATELAVALRGDARQLRVSRGGELAWPRRASLDLDVEPSRLAGRTLNGGRMRARLAGGLVRIEEARIETDAGSGELAGRIELADTPPGGVLSAELDAQLRDLDPARLLSAPALAGRLAGRLELRARRPRGAPLEESMLELALRLSPSRLAGVTANDVEVVATYRERHWELRAGRIESELGKLHAVGRGDLAAIESLELALELPELGRVVPLLETRFPELATLRGGLSARAVVAGAWRAPRGEIELHASRLEAANVRVGDLHGKVSSTDGRTYALSEARLERPELRVSTTATARLIVSDEELRLEGLRLVSNVGNLGLAGRLRASELQGARIALESVDLEALAALVPALRDTGGRVSGELTLEGPVTLPAPSGDLRWESARFQDLHADRVRVTAETSEGILHAEARAERGGETILVARGAVPLKRAREDPAGLLRAAGTEVDLESPGLELPLLAPLFPEALRPSRGLARGALQLRGGAPLPQVTGSLEFEAIRLPAQPGVPEIQAGARLRGLGEAVRIEELRLVAGEHSLDAHARIAWRAREGEWDLAVDELEATVDALAVRAEGPAQLGFGANELRIERLHLISGAGELEAAGRLEGSTLHGVVARFAHLDLDTLGAHLPGVAELGGRVSGELRLEGPLDAPAVSGQAGWEGARWGRARTDRIGFAIQSDAEVTTIEAHLEQSSREIATARVRVPRAALFAEPAGLLRDPDTQLRLRAEAIDAAWLAPFARGVLRDPAGTLHLDAELRGGDPLRQVRGELRLLAGSFAVPALGRTFAPVTARVRLGPGGVQIEGIRLGERGAGAVLTGTVTLPAEGPRLELRARLENFDLSRGRRFAAALDGEIRVRGPLQGPIVEGALEVTGGRIFLPEPDDPMLREIRVLGLPDAEGGLRLVEERARPPGVWEKAAVDLALTVQPGTWVQGRGVSVEVEGRTRLTKQPLEPLHYAGALRALRGQYRLHGRRFEIQQAIAAWPGTADPDPSIHVVALHRVRHVTVVVAIAGRASAPLVSLSSTPEMEESEILAYLLFGRPVDEIGAGEADAVNSAAARMASRLAADRVAELLGDVLPIDTLEFDAAEDGSGAGVRVGKYVTRDVFVRYGQDFGTSTRARVELEWRLSPSWRIESSTTTEGTAGVDVFWNLDY